jgi:hypothetical protein
MTKWRRHFFYRGESWKTTWKLRGAVLFLIAITALLIWMFGTVAIAQSLVCKESVAHSDALLLENFDPNYLVFERAEALHRAGVASRILVPTITDGDSELSNSVSAGFVEVMARTARLPDVELIPIGEVEPISLNAAKQIRDFVLKEHIHSVVVITPGFRSRRSALVYDAVLGPAGITTGCVPVFGSDRSLEWTRTWHGIQNVLEQFLKLQYYRFYVLW